MVTGLDLWVLLQHSDITLTKFTVSNGYQWQSRSFLCKLAVWSCAELEGMTCSGEGSWVLTGSECTVPSKKLHVFKQQTFWCRGFIKRVHLGEIAESTHFPSMCRGVNLLFLNQSEICASYQMAWCYCVSLAGGSFWSAHWKPCLFESKFCFLQTPEMYLIRWCAVTYISVGNVWKVITPNMFKSSLRSHWNSMFYKSNYIGGNALASCFHYRLYRGFVFHWRSVLLLSLSNVL